MTDIVVFMKYLVAVKSYMTLTTGHGFARANVLPVGLPTLIYSMLIRYLPRDSH